MGGALVDGTQHVFHRNCIGYRILYYFKENKMFAGDPSPFVIELPQYHVPSVKTVLLHVWERVWSF